MARTFVEAHVDFPSIEADLAAIKPPSITTEDVLERLTPAIRAAIDRGATNDQIHESLEAHGITGAKTAIANIRAGKEAAAPKKRSGKKAGGTPPEPPAPASPAGGGAQETLV